jgi:hypothetical protein
MPFVAGIVFVVTGLTVMLFGLYLFYAFLPLLFAFIGFDIGMLLGRWITGDIGLIAIVLGIVTAIILAFGSYSLEPYRRVLLGSSSGVLVGLSLAAGLGLDGWFGGFLTAFLAFAGGLIGGILVLYFFDTFVVFSSAIGGASLAVAGAHLLLHGVGLVDHTGVKLIEHIGGFWSSVLIMILAAVGIVWQLSKIPKWVQWPPASRDISGTSAGRQDKAHRKQGRSILD